MSEETRDETETVGSYSLDKYIVRLEVTITTITCYVFYSIKKTIEPPLCSELIKTESINKTFTASLHFILSQTHTHPPASVNTNALHSAAENNHRRNVVIYSCFSVIHMHLYYCGIFFSYNVNNNCFQSAGRGLADIQLQLMT